jgi:hypothetical protein
MLSASTLAAGPVLLKLWDIAGKACHAVSVLALHPHVIIGIDCLGW